MMTSSKQMKCIILYFERYKGKVVLRFFKSVSIYDIDGEDLKYMDMNL